MNALEKLKSVLCSPDGEVCVHGSEEDRRIISEALSELQSAQQPAPVAQKVPDGFRIVHRDTFTRAICALAYAVNTYPDDPCGFLDAYNAMSAVGPVITSDYALVPVELSAKMFEAADNVYSSPRSMWAAMLAAAQAQEGKCIDDGGDCGVGGFCNDCPHTKHERAAAQAQDGGQ